VRVRAAAQLRFRSVGYDHAKKFHAGFELWDTAAVFSAMHGVRASLHGVRAT
jgi:hypothetical protein